jgi:hypothetical protein
MFDLDDDANFLTTQRFERRVPGRFGFAPGLQAHEEAAIVRNGYYIVHIGYQSASTVLFGHGAYLADQNDLGGAQIEFCGHLSLQGDRRESIRTKVIESSLDEAPNAVP